MRKPYEQKLGGFRREMTIRLCFRLTSAAIAVTAISVFFITGCGVPSVVAPSCNYCTEAPSRPDRIYCKIDPLAILNFCNDHLEAKGYDILSREDSRGYIEGLSTTRITRRFLFWKWQARYRINVRLEGDLASPRCSRLLMKVENEEKPPISTEFSPRETDDAAGRIKRDIIRALDRWVRDNGGRPR